MTIYAEPCYKAKPMYQAQLRQLVKSGLLKQAVLDGEGEIEVMANIVVCCDKKKAKYQVVRSCATPRKYVFFIDQKDDPKRFKLITDTFPRQLLFIYPVLSIIDSSNNNDKYDESDVVILTAHGETDYLNQTPLIDIRDDVLGKKVIPEFYKTTLKGDTINREGTTSVNTGALMMHFDRKPALFILASCSQSKKKMDEKELGEFYSKTQADEIRRGYDQDALVAKFSYTVLRSYLNEVIKPLSIDDIKKAIVDGPYHFHITSFARLQTSYVPQNSNLPACRGIAIYPNIGGCGVIKDTTCSLFTCIHSKMLAYECKWDKGICSESSICSAYSA